MSISSSPPEHKQPLLPSGLKPEGEQSSPFGELGKKATVIEPKYKHLSADTVKHKPNNKPLGERQAKSADQDENSTLPTIQAKKATLVNTPNGRLLIEEEPDLEEDPSLKKESHEMPLTPEASSANVLNAPDGTLLIEAGDNPESSAEKLVEEVEKKHGKNVAGKAKKFFGAVLSKIKDNKAQILTVVGFAVLVGGIAGGIAFPAVFILAAPGIIMLGCGVSDLLGGEMPKLETPPLGEPPENPANEKKKETDEKDKPVESDPKKTANNEVQTETTSPLSEPVLTDKPSTDKNAAKNAQPTIRSSASTSTNTTTSTDAATSTDTATSTLTSSTVANKSVGIASAEGTNSDDFKVKHSRLATEQLLPSLKPSDPGYEDWKATEKLRENLKDQEASVHLLKVKPDSKGMSETIRFLKDENLSASGKLTERDFEELNVENALNDESFNEEQLKSFYHTYSQIAVGYDFYLWKEGSDAKKHSAVSQIKSKELVALRISFKREALRLTIEAIRNNERVDAAKIATKATHNLEKLAARLTPPADQKSEGMVNNKFIKGVNEFLSGFARSIKEKQE